MNREDKEKLGEYLRLMKDLVYIGKNESVIKKEELREYEQEIQKIEKIIMPPPVPPTEPEERPPTRPTEEERPEQPPTERPPTQQPPGQQVPGHPGYFVPPPGYYPWPPPTKKEKKEIEKIEDLLNKKWHIVSNPTDFYWNLIHDPNSLHRESKERRMNIIKVKNKFNNLKRENKEFIKKTKKKALKKLDKLEKEMELYDHHIINETIFKRSIAENAIIQTQYLKIGVDPRSKSYFKLKPNELQEYIEHPDKVRKETGEVDNEKNRKKKVKHFFQVTYEYYLEAHRIMGEMEKMWRGFFSK